MAFLESLASGLRGAGAVLSPDVYGNQVQDERIRQAQLERRNTLYAQQVIKGIEEGAITPEAGRAALGRLGLPDVPVGLSMAGQERQEKVKRRQEALQQEQAFRTEISQLPPEERGNPAVLAGVFLKHGKSEVGARLIDAAEQRSQRMQEQLLRIQERIDDRTARSEDKALDREQRAAAQREANDLKRMHIEGQQQLRQDRLLMARALGGASGRAPMGYRWKQDGSLEPIPGGPADKPPEKALPVSAAQKLFENQQNLRRAEQALALTSGEDVKDESGNVVMKGDKNATGYKGFLPDFILQRVDAQGVPTRATIADLGSLIIHDRSGAAVTAAEFPRLRPFIPSEKDDPDTVRTKLRRFTAEYRKVVEETTDFFKESGYRVPSEKLKGSGTSAPTTTTPATRGVPPPPPGFVENR